MRENLDGYLAREKGYPLFVVKDQDGEVPRWQLCAEAEIKKNE